MSIGAPASEDVFSAPADYDALHRQYYSYVCGLVQRFGIDRQSAEDVASAILLRFMERDFLNEFNPDYHVEYKGKARPARFKTFLSVFVSVYVRHHRDVQAQRKTREPLVCDAPVGEGGSSWIDVFAPATTDDHYSVEEAELVATIRAHLVEVPRRSRQDVCDLPRLFDLVVEQVRREGRVVVKDLQAAFGVSDTAIHTWLGRLRVEVRMVVDAEAAAFAEA